MPITLIKKGKAYVDELSAEEMRGVPRHAENKKKIECGREHFVAINDQDEPVKYVVTDTLDGLLVGD